MDERLIRSLTKWPSVPNCFGWLSLDRRGKWRIPQEHAINNPTSGEVIRNAHLNAVIAHNYASDEFGRYFFQNGPQRVFITLEATPWIARLIPHNQSFLIKTQCHSQLQPIEAFYDEAGNVYISGLIMHSLTSHNSPTHFYQEKRHNVALLHDHDLELFTNLAKFQNDLFHLQGLWSWNGEQLPMRSIRSCEIPSMFGFIKNPN